MTLGTVLIILLIIALLGGFRDWGNGPGYGWGPVGYSVPGILLVIVIVLLLTGRI